MKGQGPALLNRPPGPGRILLPLVQERFCPVHPYTGPNPEKLPSERQHRMAETGKNVFRKQNQRERLGIGRWMASRNMTPPALAAGQKTRSVLTKTNAARTSACAHPACRNNNLGGRLFLVRTRPPASAPVPASGDSLKCPVPCLLHVHHFTKGCEKTSFFDFVLDPKGSIV